MIARRLRARRQRPHSRWHLDEMFANIGGKQMYLWRAIDGEGEVLEVLLQAKRDRRAAQKLMRKLLKRQGMAPDEWVIPPRFCTDTFCCPLRLGSSVFPAVCHGKGALVSEEDEEILANIFSKKTSG